MTPFSCSPTNNVDRIVIDSLCEAIPIELAPVRRHDLVSGIRPVVRVMNIEQYLHARSLRSLAAAYDVFERAVICPLRIVPQAQAHQPCALIGEQYIGIHRVVAGSVAGAAILHFVDIGKIGAKVRQQTAGNSRTAGKRGVASAARQAACG